MDEALHKVGLSLREVARRYPHELSGGQLQRVAIARALIPNPSLLIADEPVSMVDASLRMSIVDLLRDLRDDFGVTVIYITHDLATAYYISDRLVIMQKGYVVEMGPARPILDAPEHPYSRLLEASVCCPSPMRGPGHSYRGPIGSRSGLGAGGGGNSRGARGWPLRQGVAAKRTIVQETGGNGTSISPSTTGGRDTERRLTRSGSAAVLLAWRSASASCRHSTAAT